MYPFEDINPFEKLVYTDEPELLAEKVNSAITEGFDFSIQPIVVASFCCQWMRRAQSYYSYRFITKRTISELADAIEKAREEGYGRHYEIFEWRGHFNQWMKIRRGFVVGVERAAVRTENWAGVLSPNAGFKLVESVQRLSVPFVVLPEVANG